MLISRVLEGMSLVVCTTARVLEGHKSARSVKIGQKTRPLAYLGNFIIPLGQTDLQELFRTLKIPKI